METKAPRPPSVVSPAFFPQGTRKEKTADLQVPLKKKLRKCCENIALNIAYGIPALFGTLKF